MLRRRVVLDVRKMQKCLVEVFDWVDCFNSYCADEVIETSLGSVWI